jgi:hypothetical protein
LNTLAWYILNRFIYKLLGIIIPSTLVLT